MGIGYCFNCPKCGKEEIINFETGMMYPKLLKEFRKKALKGKFGNEWKDLVAQHPDSRVDAKMFLYRCPECKSWRNEPSFDIYYPEEGSDVYKEADFSNEGYRLVKEYTHLCKCCNKPMKKYKSIGRLKLKCPDCGTPMEFTPSVIMWD